MLRCMLGSVKGEKSENPKEKLGNRKRGEVKKNLLIELGVIIVLNTSTDVLFQRIPTNYKIKSTEWETYIKL